MKKLWLFGSLAALLAIGLALFFTLGTSKSYTPPDVSTMNLTRLPVQFSHVAMQSVECGTCHHEVDGKENYKKCSSQGCHDILGSNARRQVRSYYRITHEPAPGQYSCIKCHLEVTAQKPELKQALTACSGSLCHPQ